MAAYSNLKKKSLILQKCFYPGGLIERGGGGGGLFEIFRPVNEVAKLAVMGHVNTLLFFL